MGERVVLDGTVQIDSAWIHDEGHVYKTKLKQDVTQLFVDQQLMTLARFPNALAFSNEVWHRNAARLDKSRASTNGHVLDGGQGARSIAALGSSLNDCVALLNFGAHSTASRLVDFNMPMPVHCWETMFKIYALIIMFFIRSTTLA